MLSASWSDIDTILNKAPEYLDIITGVVTDPGLKLLADRIRTIGNINDAEKLPITAAAKPEPAYVSKGPVNLDLKRFVTPIDAYIYYRRHSWILPVGIGGALVVLMGLGFVVGRVSKRCSSKAIKV